MVDGLLVLIVIGVRHDERGQQQECGDDAPLFLVSHVLLPVIARIVLGTIMAVLLTSVIVILNDRLASSEVFFSEL